MKRFFALSMVFCLLMALCIPSLASGVSAADTYVFERMPDVALFSNRYEFILQEFYSDLYLIYEGFLPEGSYMLEFSDSSDSLFYLDLYPLEYFYADGALVTPAVCYDFAVTPPDGVLLDLSVAVTFYYFEAFDFTVCSLSLENDEGSFLLTPDFLFVTPVVSSSGLVSSLNSDLISGIFTQILGLLPVTLGFLVSVFGLRKAIAFVVGVLRNS